MKSLQKTEQTIQLFMKSTDWYDEQNKKMSQ